MAGWEKAQGAERWAEGGAGEKLVARELDRLPRGTWSFWHDAPISSTGANADHVLVGPPGVFCLDTNNLSEPATVNPSGVYVGGQLRPDFIGKAVTAARAVGERLRSASGINPFVRPVLVFVDQVPAFFGNPYVLAFAHHQLVSALLQLPPRLPPQMLQRLRAAVRDPATWKPL